MNKLNIVVATALTFGILAGGIAAVGAANSKPDRPSWVTADGKSDLSKMPDDAQIPYQCWSGKMVTLEGKTIKQKERALPNPGSEDHKLGMEKMKELSQIPGVVTVSNGRQVVNIDDSNPAIQKVMKKYEAKETPQCQ